MGKQELNNWAVMNYSMEDRGAQPQEPEHGHGVTQRNQTDRFLSGNLSYFGVNSLFPPQPSAPGDRVISQSSPGPHACCAFLAGCLLGKGMSSHRAPCV